MVAPREGMTVLEVGGGLSGLQFVLSREGCRVVNVDPGMPEHGWTANRESVERLNRVFRTSVEIQNRGIEDARLETGFYDRALCLSVLEHLPQGVANKAMEKMLVALKPGGLCILTVDLFLDVAPFSDREENEYGRNILIPDLIGKLDFELVVGDTRELHGFPDFQPKAILADLATYYVAHRYPALTQALVLRKRVEDVHPDRPVRRASSTPIDAATG